MPDIKHTFAGAKMNKDLDERLVPNGEYRDAMNIQIRTTDGGGDGVGDAGTAQNIQGTRAIMSEVHYEDYRITDDPYLNRTTVVGSIADEKVNKAYFFVAGLDFPRVLADEPDTGSSFKFIDYIIEVDTKTGQSSPTISPVVVDRYGYLVSGKGSAVFFGDDSNGNSINPPAVSGYTEFQVSSETIENLRIGMIIEAYGTFGIQGNLGITRQEIGRIHNLEKGAVNIVKLYGESGFTNWADTTLLYCNSPRVLNFNNKRRISAINIIDNLLFWTDGKTIDGKAEGTEPKRINIKKSKEGTANYLSHTQIMLSDPSDPPTGLTNFTNLNGNGASDPNSPQLETSISPIINNDLKEEHITVIRPAPRYAPTLEMSSSTRDGEISVAFLDYDFLGVDNSFAEGSQVSFSAVNTNGENIISNSAWQVNDILTFTEMVENEDEQAVIKATIDDIDQDAGNLIITILSISVGYSAANPNIQYSGVWQVELEDRSPLFELKFGRFAYRYKYDNNEYSSFSPWSKLAFLPGRLDYNHKKGYNLGMVNTVRSLKIKDFIPHQRIRQGDIVAIDVLYKTTESPNVYVVKTITRDLDGEWEVSSLGSIVNSSSTVIDELKFGELSITSEMIHKVLEKNQLLRAWDNVPRVALAQEIAANRVVFGNYVQGYDRQNQVGLHQSLISHDDASPQTPQKSIKSIREYTFGMVFGDKYGRETPVVSSGYLKNGEIVSGDINVAKEFASMRNRFELKQVWDNNGVAGAPDDWMSYVKYYVKETSNEYYNLVMDKWYDAEDGNVWVSFPSSERNKLDENTYLLLKKGHGSFEPVVEKARYKVIAIENEPPNFIKVDPRIMGKVQLSSTPDFFDQDDPASTIDQTNFQIPNDLSGAFNATIGGVVDTQNQSPVGLMTQGGIYVHYFNNFLGSYVPKGDLKVRVAGKMNNEWRYSNKWLPVSNINYYVDASGNENTGSAIVRWSGTFGFEADMKLKFAPGGGTTLGSITYYLEFKEDVLKDTVATFDGKFFVKLERDSILENKVMNLGNNDTAWFAASTYNIAYIDNQEENPAVPIYDQYGSNIHPRSEYKWHTTSSYGTANEQDANGVDGSADALVVLNPQNEGQSNIAKIVGFGNELLGGDTMNMWVSDAAAQGGKDIAALDGAGGLNISNASYLMALGCDGGVELNNSYNPKTYLADITGFNQEQGFPLPASMANNQGGPSQNQAVVNFTRPTRDFWNWWTSEAAGYSNLTTNTYKPLNTELFIDACRTKEMILHGDMQDDSQAAVASGMFGTPFSVGPNNLYEANADTPGSGDFKSAHYYRPTGLDAGLQTGTNFQQTQNGQLGRMFVSTISSKYGWGGFNQGPTASFINHFSQPGRKFKFIGDPNEYMYEIVGQVDYVGIGDLPYASNYSQANDFAISPLGGVGNPNDPNSSFSQVGLWSQIIGGIGGNSPTNYTFSYYDNDPNFSEGSLMYNQEDSGPSLTDLTNSGLAQIILIGGSVLLGGDEAAYDCIKCNALQTPFTATDEVCARAGFRFEFRRYDEVAGKLEGAGDIGIDHINEWDPRGMVCHDGREALALQTWESAASMNADANTSNAATFETEPKEDIGLDLWYEASNAIPMRLDDTNAPDFAPYHSKVTLRVPDANGNPGAHVDWATGWNHRVSYIGHIHQSASVANRVVIGIEYNPNAPLPNIWEPYLSDDVNIPTAGAPQIYALTIPAASRPFFVFEHKDGTKTMAKVIGRAKPIDTEGNDYQIGYFGDTVPGFPVPLPAYATTDGNATPLDYISEVRFKKVESNGDQPPLNVIYSQSLGINVAPENTGFFIIDIDVWKWPVNLSWFNCYSWGNGIESDRIRDDFNAPTIDNGVKVSTTFLGYGEEQKGSGMIYSGIYNSTSGVNNLNEFNQAEKITKDLNPSYGSIQALKTRDTNVVVLTEDKVLQVTTNRDALYNADGNPQLLASNRVLGTAVPFAGDYGISNNPESLAWDQFRLYFTDMQRGAVLRLSGNGITPISNVGMKTWFRENLRKTYNLVGSFDGVNGEYNLTLNYLPGMNEEDKTVSFNEASKGWTSFKSFIPQSGLTVGGKYITGKQTKPTIPDGVVENQKSFTLWEHYVDIKNQDDEIINRNIFYSPTSFIVTGDGSNADPYFTSSSINILFNDLPSSIKSFNSIDYEGSQSRVLQFSQEQAYAPNGVPLGQLSDGQFYNLSAKDGWWVSNITTDQSLKGDVLEFIKKEGKWFNKIGGGERGDITNNDLNEFSVQGLSNVAIVGDPTTTVQISLEDDNSDQPFGGLPGYPAAE